jgi:hypothetical protein
MTLAHSSRLGAQPESTSSSISGVQDKAQVPPGTLERKDFVSGCVRHRSTPGSP